MFSNCCTICQSAVGLRLEVGSSSSSRATRAASLQPGEIVLHHPRNASLALVLPGRAGADPLSFNDDYERFARPDRGCAEARAGNRRAAGLPRAPADAAHRPWKGGPSNTGARIGLGEGGASQVPGPIAKIAKFVPGLHVEPRERAAEKLVDLLVEGEINAAMFGDVQDMPARIDDWSLFEER